MVNIHTDGSLRGEDFQTVSLDDDAGLEAYIKDGKEAADGAGHTPILHIRGSQDTVFKHCRKVIRIAARVGVSQVAFGGYTNDK